MQGNIVRLGLVGVGKIARTQHLPAILGNPRFELAATADPEGTVEGVPGFTSLESLLAADIAIDAVCLCTPPAVRADIALQALAGGLHVLLEKPPAAAISQVEAMLLAARQAGRSIMASWHSRETPAVDAARDWLADKPILAIEVIWKEDVRQWHPGQEWLLDAGGFGVFDPAINAFSILSAILPQAIALRDSDLFIPDNRAAPMRAALTLSHGGAAPLTCDLSILHEGRQQWDIAIKTEAGTLLLGDGGHRLEIGGELIATVADTEYRRIYAAFAGLIDAGGTDVDVRPLILAADAMLLGRRHRLERFDF